MTIGGIISFSQGTVGLIEIGQFKMIFLGIIFIAAHECYV